MSARAVGAAMVLKLPARGGVPMIWYPPGPGLAEAAPPCEVGEPPLLCQLGSAAAAGPPLVRRAGPEALILPTAAAEQ